MWLAMLGVVAFSLSAPTTKLVVEGASVPFAAAARGVVAGLVGGAVLLARGVPFPVDHWRRILVIVCGVVIGFPLLNAWGLHSVSSAHGALVIALLPLATAGVAARIAGERPNTRYWACSAAAVATLVAFAFRHGTGGVGLGDLVLLAAVLAAAVGYAYGGLVSRSIPGGQVFCWASVVALPITLRATIYSVGHGAGAPDTAGQWTAFLYTALFSSLLGFFAWYAGMAKAGIARASQLQLTQPMLSLVWAWPIVGEPLTLAAMATGAVVVTSVTIGRR
jgi:drug/metabolite transporter (DMT)-like permease